MAIIVYCDYVTNITHPDGSFKPYFLRLVMKTHRSQQDSNIGVCAVALTGKDHVLSRIYLHNNSLNNAGSKSKGWTFSNLVIQM